MFVTFFIFSLLLARNNGAVLALHNQALPSRIFLLPSRIITPCRNSHNRFAPSSPLATVHNNQDNHRTALCISTAGNDGSYESHRQRQQPRHQRRLRRKKWLSKFKSDVHMKVNGLRPARRSVKRRAAAAAIAILFWWKGPNMNIFNSNSNNIAHAEQQHQKQQNLYDLIDTHTEEEDFSYYDHSTGAGKVIIRSDQHQLTGTMIINNCNTNIAAKTVVVAGIITTGIGTKILLRRQQDNSHNNKPVNRIPVLHKIIGAAREKSASAIAQRKIQQPLTGTIDLSTKSNMKYTTDNTKEIATKQTTVATEKVKLNAPKKGQTKTENIHDRERREAENKNNTATSYGEINVTDVPKSSRSIVSNEKPKIASGKTKDSIVENKNITTITGNRNATISRAPAKSDAAIGSTNSSKKFLWKFLSNRKRKKDTTAGREVTVVDNKKNATISSLLTANATINATSNDSVLPTTSVRDPAINKVKKKEVNVTKKIVPKKEIKAKSSKEEVFASDKSDERAISSDRSSAIPSTPAISDRGTSSSSSAPLKKVSVKSEANDKRDKPALGDKQSPATKGKNATISPSLSASAPVNAAVDSSPIETIDVAGRAVKDNRKEEANKSEKTSTVASSKESMTPVIKEVDIVMNRNENTKAQRSPKISTSAPTPDITDVSARSGSSSSSSSVSTTSTSTSSGGADGNTSTRSESSISTALKKSPLKFLSKKRRNKRSTPVKKEATLRNIKSNTPMPSSLTSEDDTSSATNATNSAGVTNIVPDDTNREIKESNDTKDDLVIIVTFLTVGLLAIYSAISI